MILGIGYKSTKKPRLSAKVCWAFLILPAIPTMFDGRKTKKAQCYALGFCVEVSSGFEPLYTVLQTVA
jgi:hypothetical protein